jgi:hypothetical protein
MYGPVAVKLLSTAAALCIAGMQKKRKEKRKTKMNIQF